MEEFRNFLELNSQCWLNFQSSDGMYGMAVDFNGEYEGFMSK